GGRWSLPLSRVIVWLRLRVGRRRLALALVVLLLVALLLILRILLPLLLVVVVSILRLACSAVARGGLLGRAAAVAGLVLAPGVGALGGRFVLFAQPQRQGTVVRGVAPDLERLRRVIAGDQRERAVIAL